MIDKVLLIDDDEMTLLICEFVLEKELFASEVIKLRNGQEGVEYFHNLIRNGHHLIKDKIPKLILLDLNMPVLNGWEFLDEFGAHFSEKLEDVKICILTSSIDPLDVSSATVNTNVIGFIHKPLTVERLEELKENEHLVQYFSD